MTPDRIGQPGDPRLDAFREIRERDRQRAGTFIAEGEVVVRRLLTRSRFRALAVLLDETRYAAMASFLDGLADAPPVLVAPRALVSEIAGFPLHRGCLAVAERGPDTDPDSLLAALPARALVLAAVGIANHDNMGGLFRNAAAFGTDLVLLDETSCDPLYRKALRVSVGAALSVPFARVAQADLIDALARHGLEPIALSPAGRETLADLPQLHRATLIAGAEGPGLPPAILARCRTVAIPMANGFDSLNVATASGIALHHLTRRT